MHLICMHKRAAFMLALQLVVAAYPCARARLQVLLCSRFGVCLVPWALLGSLLWAHAGA